MFLNMMLTVFLAELNPDSTIAKPACMNKTSTAERKQDQVVYRIGNLIHTQRGGILGECRGSEHDQPKQGDGNGTQFGIVFHGAYKG